MLIPGPDFFPSFFVRGALELSSRRVFFCPGLVLREALVHLEMASGDDLPEEPTQQPPPNDGDEGVSPPAASSIPSVPAVYADAITPSKWAELSPGLRVGMIPP